MRYSYVFNLPDKVPFNNGNYLQQSFAGEFVKPIIEKNPDLLYWFSFYEEDERLIAKFRTAGNTNSDLELQISKHAETLGLEFLKTKEVDETIITDLARPRFFNPAACPKETNAAKRAELLIRSLTATANLMLDSLYKRDDGYWDYELTADGEQNPISGLMFSVNHLYHNMTGVKTRVYVFQDSTKEYGINAIAYYDFKNNYESKSHNPPIPTFVYFDIQL